MEYRIGCSGFYNKHWKGLFYPMGMVQQHWFGYYCQHFNTLEINVTFYRFPRQDVMQGWWIKSPEDFKFSVKAPRAITHLRKFVDCQKLLDDFYNSCDKGLKGKLSALLFQLPPAMHYSEEKLMLVCNSLRRNYMNVVEFRHESWWRKEVYDMLRFHDILFCNISHPKLPGGIIKTARTLYVRLHGVPEMFYSAYSKEQLGQLIEDIKKQEGVEEVFIYFNNTAGDAGILNAGELRDMVKK